MILPLGTEKLFSGGTFDKHYNDEQGKAVLRTPRGTSRVLLYAVITGNSSTFLLPAQLVSSSRSPETEYIAQV